MADNVAITAGSGTTIAADDIGGVLHQRIKISQGADGTGVDVSAAAPLQVSVANTGVNATAVKVDGSAVTQPVSGTVTINAVPAGTNNIGDVDVLTINGVAPAFGTGAAGATVLRTLSSTDDPVVSAINAGVAASLPAGTNNIGDVDVLSSALPTGAATSAKQDTIIGHVDGIETALAGTLTVASHAVTNAGTFAVQSAGGVAHDGADSGNPIKIGGRARSSEVAAVASDDRVDAVFDLTGKQIVLPYANPENFVSGAITSAMTGTTSTSLVAAPASGLRNYITTIIVSNAHATVGTDVIIQDGSGGTTLLTIPAAAVYGGAVINLPVPLRQPTTATAIFCANVTTGASTKVSAVGYKGV